MILPCIQAWEIDRHTVINASNAKAQLEAAVYAFSDRDRNPDKRE